MTPSRPAPAPSRPLLPFVFLAAAIALVAPAAFAQVPRPDAVSHGMFAAGWQRGTPASAVGTLTVMYADDFANRRAERLYFVRDERTGRAVQIQFERAPATLRTGARVTLIGRAVDGQLYVAAGQVDASTATAPAAAAPPTTAAATADPAAGQRTLAIVADFRDACVTCAPGDIDNVLFDDPAGQSVSALYRDNSRGQVVLSGDVVGPYQIDYASTDPCDIGAWAKAADAKAAAAGVSLADYQRRVYVMPAANCPAAGYGTVGGSPGYAWIFVCAVKGLFAHEIGHTLGFDHAGTPDSDYGDTTDPMAFSENRLRGLNGAHRQQMGWLPSQSVLAVSQSGTYEVAALASAASTLPQLITVAKPDTSEYYYLSYRDPEGYDAFIDSSYYSRLSVHRYKGDGSSSKTYLLAGLSDGGRFDDSTNGVTITLVGHTATTATVQVDLSCSPRAPTLSLAPGVQSAAPGGSLTYDISLSNQDGPACGASTFALAGSIPSGWTGTLSPATLQLSPGASGQAAITVTSANGAAAGSFALSVSAGSAGQALHAATAGATYTVLDAAAPSAPSGLSAAVDSKRKVIQLAWKPSIDNVGVAGYQVSRNGAVVATVSGTAWSDPAWGAGATYSYVVRAYDAAGNASNPSNAATVTLSGGGRKR